ncbi:DNA polymerase III subunit delta' [Acetobacter thailandicus]|uniref:DNA polymerase III subunit delta' n=1 Tax=Acetobacter thailandicus TaxID=1502842 RepID=UPI001BA5DEA8|nr:DNA polymerase III subunit delta' [Acetobacter thailandicus]MBS0959591.1 DNA polymerase III subunit delta' [Acetobacter thailandicus]
MTSPGEDPRLSSLHLQGHQSAIQLFTEAKRSGRMPHAWLLTGPPGIGKATLAFHLARMVLGGESAESPAGRRISAATHADLLVISRSYDEKRQRYRGEIVMDEVRPVNDFLHRTAAEGGWRVVIVDGAEWMNRNAANALLKILEEPPPSALLLLTSSSPGRLLPTIRSRCQRIDLKPLSSSELAAVIAREAPGTAPAELERALSAAQGSPGRVFDLLADEGGQMAGLVQQALNGVSVSDAYIVAETVLKKENGFNLFFSLLSNALQEQARSSARQGLTKSVFFAKAWENVRRLQNETDHFNLDKQEALLEAMMIAGKV